AGIRAPHHRQHDAAGAERRPQLFGRAADDQRLHLGGEHAILWLKALQGRRVLENLPAAPRRASNAGPAVLVRRPMSAHSLLLLPGDGIGPEVTAEVERLI